MTKPWDTTSERLLRELAPQALGVVARRFRDFASAEDAVQEAMLAAFTQWPLEGVPENPRGWLIQVASRRMTDQVRSEIARRQRESAAARDVETATGGRRYRARHGHGPGRHADSAVPVLPPRAHFVLGDCTDAAGRRRLDDGGDCQCIPGSRGYHGAADQPREAEHQGFGRAIPFAFSTGARRTVCPQFSACST